MTRTALIIEDDLLIAFELEDILADLGFKVVGACTTETQAVEAALKTMPDLLLVDCRLAEGNGLNAVKRIGESLDVRAVFVTANRDELRRNLSDAVCVDKPFDRGMIERAIRTVFAGGSKDPGSQGGEPADGTEARPMLPGDSSGETRRHSPRRREVDLDTPRLASTGHREGRSAVPARPVHLARNGRARQVHVVGPS